MMGDITHHTPQPREASMFLRDRPLLNALRRLRGWRKGDVRVMVEARRAGAHVFVVFECRSDGPAQTEARVAEALAPLGLDLVEIAQEKPATVPMPRDCRVVRLSDPIPLAAAEVPAPAAPQPTRAP
jgi:hypothetical protein